MSLIDWMIIISVLLIYLSIGLYSYKYSDKNTTDFFLAKRKMPWWIFGVSMVATPFATDTHNLVTSLVHKNGISGNWVWWAFLITDMLPVENDSKTRLVN